MSRTKIKRDTHGLYARGAGYIWRADYPRGYSHAHGPTVFQEGDEVSVSHSGGSLASVKRRDDGTREHWYAHGSYIRIVNGDLVKGWKPSDEIYRPDHKNWE